jgi:7-carboxy-7-deazaguanine synthase
MMYGVKEMFYSLCGEGANTGRPAVFVRLAGCNLWSGSEVDRMRAICGFCDTDFVGTDGPHGGRYVSPGDLAREAGKLWPATWLGRQRPLCVLTGGEPTLQADPSLCAALRGQGFEVAIETNGTRPVPPGVDWITVSPKAGAEVVQRCGDELKMVYPQAGLHPESFASMDFRLRYIQPKDGPDREDNVKLATRFCLDHLWWRLSLQVHKILGLN